MKKMKIVLRNMSLVAALSCISVLCSSSSIAQSGADTLYKQNRNFTEQTSLYDIYKTEKADVVMLGNSITFGVNWNELMGRTTIVNRGIGSDNTYGFLQRMEFVYKLHPKACCVMGGINDIYQDIPVAQIFENYKQIVEGIQSHGIIPIIQSTLFVSPKWKRSAEKNRDVAALDSMLTLYAAQHGFDFVNLNAVMSKENLLRDELTTDGVHLTAQGYVLWRDELEKIFRKYGL